MPAGFDRVLVDAPCSGTGTWRRNPDAKWRLTPGDLDELVDLQRRILDSAARLVKPGGRLVYATCSLLPRENGEQVDWFLAQTELHGAAGRGDLASVDRRASAGFRHRARSLLSLTPASHGTDGFFVAVMECGKGRGGSRGSA